MNYADEKPTEPGWYRARQKHKPLGYYQAVCVHIEYTDYWGEENYLCFYGPNGFQIKLKDLHDWQFGPKVEME